MPKETVHLSLDSELLARVDADRNRTRHTRSAWMAMAAEQRLTPEETHDDEDER